MAVRDREGPVDDIIDKFNLLTEMALQGIDLNIRAIALLRFLHDRIQKGELVLSCTTSLSDELAEVLQGLQDQSHKFALAAKKSVMLVRGH